MSDQTCLRCGESAATVIAQGSDRLYGTTSQVFAVVRCIRCGMARLSPRPDAASLGQYYPDQYWFDPSSSPSSQWAERYRRFVLRDHIHFVLGAARAAGPGGRILDVGCGGGLLAGLLREHHAHVFGLDVSSAACRIAWQRHAVPAVTGDLVQAPFPPASLSLITMFHVLEHLPDPGAFLAVARELLAPEGRLVVQVPNVDSWQFRLLGARWNGLDVPRHLNHFRPADLRVLLNRHGFEPVRWKHFSLRDNPAGLATSIAPALDPMSRRVRRKSSGWLTLGGHFALVLAALPFALLEAAFGHGSSVMIEARVAPSRKS